MLLRSRRNAPLPIAMGAARLGLRAGPILLLGGVACSCAAPAPAPGAGLAAGAAGRIAFAGSLSGSVDFGETSLVSAGSLDVVAGVIAP
jgi:hypothetical protein